MPLPIEPLEPGDKEFPVIVTEPGSPQLPGLGAYNRKRYTCNVGIFEEMTVADLINEVINISCRGWQRVTHLGKIGMRNKKPVDYAYAIDAVSGTTIEADDVSPWVASLAQHIVIDPHTVNSEVRNVIEAVYPTSQNSTTLTAVEDTGGGPGPTTDIAITAFTGATGGTTPATATIDTADFEDGTEYTITLDGVDTTFIPSALDTGESLAAFLAGAIMGDPRLNRRFRASYEDTLVTVTAKFGTLTLNTALTRPHVAPIANPTSAPTLTAGTGELPAGEYRVAYTYRNDRGQTLLSPFKAITLSADEKIIVDPVTPPAGTSVVWYVSVEAGSTEIRYYSENDGSSFEIDWPLPKRSAPRSPALNRTGAEIIRVSAVYSDREEERSAIGASNVIKDSLKWQLGSRRSRKNVVELTYRQANQDYRLVTLRERDDANIAKVKERKTEKINGQAIDTYFQAKRISSGLLAEWLDADFFYRWTATRRALLQEEGDVVVITDAGSGVINLPVWIEEMETSAPNSGLPRVSFTAHKYYSTLYDDSINEVIVPIVSEI